MRWLIALWIVATTIAVIATHSDIVIPRCTEDAVLVGFGSFEDGHWTQYRCGPAFDDIAPR
jgi:hypothetical protein